jgi:putative chitinase
MQITEQQLQQILPGNSYIAKWCNALNTYFPTYEIDTTYRIAQFLAQTYVESEAYTALIENLNYSAQSLMRVWPNYFPTIQIANEYAHHPEQIANRTYANRLGNGDEASGDGWRYIGRGLIQITGKYNYNLFAQNTDMDITQVPAYLLTFDGAVEVACWFWSTHNLNQYSDTQNTKEVTYLINGGYTDLQQREAAYSNALTILEQ